ncbi:hypothetical protein [Lacticaseibacillus daqingensis]|uniref:hypothetical protein n=1 Tax=Lacticaseibacillus daqingensis TaxID=2486014 RepID=UPI000F7BACA0|nr:hypothetical protein [Lacticaseibacillus daqingensis]
MKRLSLRHRIVFACVGVGALLLLALGGFLLVRHNQTAQRVAAATRVFKQLKADQATLTQAVAQGWTDDQHHYVRATVTPAAITALQTRATKLTATAKPYATVRDPATASKVNTFTQAQRMLGEQLQRLKRAQVATAAVNALFQAPFLTDATPHPAVLVREKLTAAKVAAAAKQTPTVNTTLAATLLQATTLAKAQLAERAALVEQVALIAPEGTLRPDVTLPQLTTFQAHVAQLKYAGLKAPYEALLTTVAQRAAALNSLKALSASDRQKRVLLAYAKATSIAPARLDQVRAFFVNREELTDTAYTAEIGTLNLAGDALAADFTITLTATVTGAYTLTRSGQPLATGDLMQDFTAADTAKLTRDPAKIVAPKLTEAQFKQAITADFAAQGLAVAQLEFPQPATVTGDTIALQIVLGDGAQVRYNAATGEGEWYDYAIGPSEAEGYRYDAKLTTAIWAQAAGD